MAATYQPVIIIGAPRSGTNMLRDVVTCFEGVGTWPCDEINYIWRYGNRGHFSDEFSPELATPRVRNYIQAQFDRIAHRQRLRYVVEKTCANSLRVGFVNRVFPRAKYIYLVRDGRDTIASAMKRWKAPLDLSYTLRKARFVPLSDIPYYGMRFIRNRFAQFASNEKKIKFWGPIFEGMDHQLRDRALSEVCALQWKKCVVNAERDFAQITPGRVCRVQYETFVTNPVQELGRIADFLGLCTSHNFQKHTIDVKVNNIGKWRNDLNQSDLDKILPLIQDELIKYGYD